MFRSLEAEGVVHVIIVFSFSFRPRHRYILHASNE